MFSNPRRRPMGLRGDADLIEVNLFDMVRVDFQPGPEIEKLPSVSLVGAVTMLLAAGLTPNFPRQLLHYDEDGVEVWREEENLVISVVGAEHREPRTAFLERMYDSFRDLCEQMERGGWDEALRLRALFALGQPPE